MLTKPLLAGPAKTVRIRIRKQKRNKRRLVEAVAQDWERWDAAAAIEGVNWSEFCRRALATRCDVMETRKTALTGEKP